MMDKEIRYFESPVTIRAKDDGDSRTIEGIAAVFDKLSRNLGWFREKIDPAAFDNCDMADVIACRNHDPDKVMARTTAKTLDLDTDKVGLNYSFEAPETSAGNDTLEDIRIGNIRHSSFAFTVSKDMWEEDEDGGEIRTILEFKKLYDVSPVTNPAYFGTDVSVNEFDVAKRSHELWKKSRKVHKDAAETIKEALKEKEETPADTLSVREAEQILIEIN